MAARSTSPATPGGHHNEVVGAGVSAAAASLPAPSSSPSAAVPAPAASHQASSPLPESASAARPAPTATRNRQRPLKQKMALSFKSLVSSAQKLVLGDNNNTTTTQNSNTPSSPTGLFPATDPAVDGEDCDHDCQSCSIKYPRDFKIDEADELYGHIKGWSTHVLVATGKSDWVRDVADEKGSVMEALHKYVSSSSAAQEAKDMGRMMLSASNIPTPHGTTDYSEPTTVVLLPAFAVIHNVSPAAVPALVDRFVSQAVTSTTPLSAPISIPRSVPLLNHPAPSADTSLEEALTATPSPHNVLILLCSQKTRDARCGQSAPLLKRELERHLRPLGLYRDTDDHRPGGVGIYFISHVGGHKYSANMMVYRRRDAYGVDNLARGKDGAEFKIDPLARFKKAAATPVPPAAEPAPTESTTETTETNGNATTGTTTVQPQEETSTTQDDVITDEGAAQCIWLARIKPEDCENIVRYTVLQGRVVKPDSQLRGGFDRGRSVVSW